MLIAALIVHDCSMPQDFGLMSMNWWFQITRRTPMYLLSLQHVSSSRWVWSRFLHISLWNWCEFLHGKQHSFDPHLQSIPLKLSCLGYTWYIHPNMCQGENMACFPIKGYGYPFIIRSALSASHHTIRFIEWFGGFVATARIWESSIFGRDDTRWNEMRTPNAINLPFNGWFIQPIIGVFGNEYVTLGLLINVIEISHYCNPSRFLI